MAYDFSTRMNTLGNRMRQLHQNTLTYTRGNTTATIPNFTPEKVDVTAIAVYGLTILTDKLQDFVFDTNKLVNFAPPEPKIGDRITWGTRTYEVLGIGPSTNEAECFKYITSSRLRIRVHARQIIDPII